MSGFTLTYTLFTLLGALFLVAVLGGCVWVIVRNFREARRHGLDPFTLQTTAYSRVLTSRLVEPSRSLEERLAQIDDLHARGLIDDDERRSARAAALADL
jgi:hypothetical protein